MTSSPVRRARFATNILFLVHGLVVAAWVSRIPTVQTELALSSGVLGLALLGVACGSIVAMPVTGALVGRFGSRSCSIATTLAFCGALALIPLANSALTLTAFLVLYGATAGAMDVSMNSQGVLVQRRYDRSIVSGFHALFSLGGMAGAYLGGVVAGWGVPATVHFAIAGVLCALLTAGVSSWLLPRSQETVHAEGPMFAMPRGPVLALGLLGWCILLCEGAIADWTAIFLRDSMSAGPAAAASGYAVFSGAMAIGRFGGDRLTDRMGAVLVIRAGAILAAFGLLTTLLAPGLALALTGLLATGFGYAAIVPNVFGAAGRIPGIPAGTGIAAVTTMGFTGFLIGPPVIGWLAEWLTLRVALYVLVLLTLAGAVLAGSIRVALPVRRDEVREVWELPG